MDTLVRVKMWIGGLTEIGLMLLAPDLVQLFAHRNAGDYLPVSANVLAILAWFLPLSFANGLLQYALIAVNQQRAMKRRMFLEPAHICSRCWRSAMIFRGVCQLSRSNSAGETLMPNSSSIIRMS